MWKWLMNLVSVIDEEPEWAKYCISNEFSSSSSSSIVVVVVIVVIIIVIVLVVVVTVFVMYLYFMVKQKLAYL